MNCQLIITIPKTHPQNPATPPDIAFIQNENRNVQIFDFFDFYQKLSTPNKIRDIISQNKLAAFLLHFVSDVINRIKFSEEHKVVTRL